LLGEAKIVFSASLQETLGIGCYEGAIVDAIPMVPDRLSYTEMYYDTFKYPSKWTESFDSYLAHRNNLCFAIMQHMDHYKTRLPNIRKQTASLTERFFSCQTLLNNLT
jgi:hypothetical protein